MPLEGYVPILGSSLEAQKAGTNACLLALLPSIEGIMHTKERKSARILEIKNLVNRRKGTVCLQQSTEGSDLHTFDAPASELSRGHYTRPGATGLAYDGSGKEGGGEGGTTEPRCPGMNALLLGG